MKKILLLVALSLSLVACSNEEAKSDDTLAENMTVEMIDKSLDNDELTEGERYLRSADRKFGDLLHIEYEEATNRYHLYIEDEELIEIYNDHLKTKNNKEWFDFEGELLEFSKLHEGYAFILWNSENKIIVSMINGGRMG